MRLVFEGQPSRAEILGALLPTMAATNLPNTQENRSKAGSAVVALSDQYDVTEIALLKCIPGIANAGKPVTQIKFPDAAVLCAVEMKVPG